jgi:predicted PurR-regulated permease PerM
MALINPSRKMKGTTIIWAAVILLILYLSWRVVAPLVGPIFFGLVLAYAAYPLHVRLKRRFGNQASGVILTLGMLLVGGALTFELLLMSARVAASFYHNVEDFFTWLLTQPLPQNVLDFIGNFSNQLIPKLADYASSYAFSIPRYLIQLLVFLLVFYYALVYADEIKSYISRSLPTENRRLGEEILSNVNKTLKALVRVWLLLNIAKGILMTVGFLIFGVSDLYTAVVAGFLTFIFSFVPLFEGWMLWLIAAAYFAKEGMYLRAIGISLYGAFLVSPMPDYTIRPVLVAKDTNLDETLVFIGMVGGAWTMGVKGILIGPIVLNLMLTLLKEWKMIIGRKRGSPRQTVAPSGPSPHPEG